MNIAKIKLLIALFFVILSGWFLYDSVVGWLSVYQLHYIIKGGEVSNIFMPIIFTVSCAIIFLLSIKFIIDRFK